jgi:regulator of sigma E protease
LTLFIGILTFFVILATLVVAHEIGHFSFAKLFGVRVEEFGVGFPPRVRSWRRGGTMYSLNAIPLGGFVKMYGENGSSDAPDSFGAKRPWQRLIILIAGPFMNLLLALVLFFVTFAIAFPDGSTVISRVQPKSPAVTAGLRAGDRIIEVDQQPVSYRSQLQQVVDAHLGKPVDLLVLRGKQKLTVRVTPRQNPKAGQGPIGILLAHQVMRRYSPVTAAQKSLQTMRDFAAGTFQMLISIPRHGTAQVSGPIGIADTTTRTVSATPQNGIAPLLLLVALLSGSLGLMNLLPIPALDGGRVLFVLISWARRRNVDPEVEGLVHLLGMTVLLLLIILISYQDVVRWVGGS